MNSKDQSQVSPLPTAVASQVNKLCLLANEASPYRPPTSPQVVVESAVHRLSAEQALVNDLKPLTSGANGRDLSSRFVQPLDLEIQALAPIVRTMDAAAAAKNTQAYSNALNQFQALASRYEPGIDAYLQGQHLTACVLGG